MNKKAICGVLTTAVLFGVCPTTAFAADMNILNKSLDFRTMTEDASGDGWNWDASSQELTLKDFQFTVPSAKLEEKAAIYLPAESSIEVKGDNNHLEVNSYRCDAIFCEGDLNIEGDGVLEITTKSSGANVIYVERGPLLIDDEVEIKTNPEGRVIYIHHAKGNRPVLTIAGDAKVTFPEDEADDQIVLITHKSSVKPSDNWLNYSEEFDEWDERFELVAKKASADKEDAADKEDTTETPAEPEKQLNEYKIIIGAKEILKNNEVSYTADVVPYLNKDGYTMLPLRALLEVSNPEQKVNWNNGTKSAHTFVNNKLVSIKPGEATYTKAMDKIVLSTPAETVEGRLFVSLRDWMSIMEINGSQLNWDAATKTVTLTY